MESTSSKSSETAAALKFKVGDIVLFTAILDAVGRVDGYYYDPQLAVKGRQAKVTAAVPGRREQGQAAPYIIDFIDTGRSYFQQDAREQDLEAIQTEDLPIVEYKVGDLVEVTEEGDEPYFHKGDKGVILSAYSNSDFRVDFSGQGNDWVEDDGKWAVNASQIALVSKPVAVEIKQPVAVEIKQPVVEFKEGDRVRMKDGFTKTPYYNKLTTENVGVVKRVHGADHLYRYFVYFTILDSQRADFSRSLEVMAKYVKDGDLVPYVPPVVTEGLRKGDRVYAFVIEEGDDELYKFGDNEFYKIGDKGTIIAKDSSVLPYLVAFDNGKSRWVEQGTVALDGERLAPLTEEQRGEAISLAAKAVASAQTKLVAAKIALQKAQDAEQAADSAKDAATDEVNKTQGALNMLLKVED